MPGNRQVQSNGFVSNSSVNHLEGIIMEFYLLLAIFNMLEFQAMKLKSDHFFFCHLSF